MDIRNFVTSKNFLFFVRFFGNNFESTDRLLNNYD